MGCLRLRKLLDADQPSFGLWISLKDPAVVEIAAHAGLDHVNIDMEHTSIGLAMVENMVRAAQACGISALVRAPGNDPNMILRIVEMGPDGIYIPHVRDAEDARRAVQAAKYAPVGDRGISGSTRAARYGVDGADFRAFAERTNRELVVWAQIEEKSALDDVEAIASVEGVDVCSAAPSDLARALGRMGTQNDPEVGAAIRHIADTVMRVGKAKLGIPIMHSSFNFDTEAVLALGARAINICIGDAKTLLNGLQANMARARASLPS